MLDVVHPSRASNNILFLLPIVLLELFIIGLSIRPVHAIPNQKLHVATLCGRKRANTLNKVVDGAVVISENDKNLDCSITFQTPSALQKFMLRFEKLSLPCTDHLFVYDSENAHFERKFNLSCDDTAKDFSNYYTKSNHVTLKYETSSLSKPENGFRLILTAFKFYENNCREFRCRNKLCINVNLTCDGYDHCGDNSDETHYAFCYADSSVGRILGLGVGIFIAVVVVVFVICFVFIISITMCICKNRALGRMRLPPPPLPMNPAVPQTNMTSSTNTSTTANHHQQGLQHFSSQPGYIRATDHGTINRHRQYPLEKSPPPLPPHRRPHQHRPLPQAYPQQNYYHPTADQQQLSEIIAYNVHQQNLYYPTKHPPSTLRK